MRLAVVEGDDLSDARGLALLREHLAPEHATRELLSANAYLGAAAIAEALRSGAQVVITGRVADPSLAVGPAMAHFGWGETDWDELARATIAGHLIECGAQVTGGYYADPGFKDVPDLHRVGFPIVEVRADGSFTVGKADGTGGVRPIAAEAGGATDRQGLTTHSSPPLRRTSLASALCINRAASSASRKRPFCRSSTAVFTAAT